MSKFARFLKRIKDFKNNFRIFYINGLRKIGNVYKDVK